MSREHLLHSVSILEGRRPQQLRVSRLVKSSSIQLSAPRSHMPHSKRTAYLEQ